MGAMKMEKSKSIPMDKDLRDWLESQCSACEMFTTDDELICNVLGEKFYMNCRNAKDEICRYCYV